jgi:predicted ATPase/DNA-binding winged helix-turn-helix (wHTH) protein/class 3 adenylate cyclase
MNGKPTKAPPKRHSNRPVSSFRKLTTVLSADAVGCSRLVGEDDRAALDAIVAARRVMATHITRHGGRVVDATGGALLAEFSSAVDSVRCAVELQADLAQRNAALPESGRMVLRIGLNVGDVIEEDRALHGEGVTVAAWLRSMGEPGGVCISGSIHDEVDGRLALRLRFAGNQAIRNIAKAIRAYHIELEAPVASTHPPGLLGLRAGPPIYRFGRCELRPEERMVLVEGRPAKLAPRALDVLLALVEARERVVTKNELLDRVWPGLQVEENNLSTQVSVLRRLVGSDAIATVSGRGYRLAVPVTCVDGPREPAAGPAGKLAGAPTEGRCALRFGALEWRPDERVAMLAGHRAELGSRAIDLLDLLIAERHRVISKRELLEKVWPGMVVEENNLQVQVSTLRKMLGQDAVATVPGFGYRFTMAQEADDRSTAIGAAPVEAAPMAAPPEPPGRTNLPHAMEALFGRADDLEQLDHLLASHRLLTLLGPGGIGKTRAAQALARMQADRFPHGAWWVDLGALSSPDEVVPAIAVATRAQLGAGDAALQLALALESRHTLIVLDNCEHLIEEVARIAKAVLEVASKAQLLATSQEPLRLEGEQVFRLGGLPLPRAGASLEEAHRCGAMMLLERRAQAASSSFALTEQVLPATIDICRQLDGIPLAIEMAAARLPQLGARALQAALAERLQWLRNSLRTAPARHKTLRATLDWSCSLLGTDEQVVLRRLAVFAASFRLEAAQRVASDVGLDGWAVAEALSTLVERSLVQVVAGEDPPRYRLLETMRLYADEQLEAHGEKASAQIAHMQLMAAIGTEAEAAYWNTPDTPWLKRYECEYDDLHAAFVHACTVKDAAAGAATLDALYRVDELHLLPIALRTRLPAANALLAHADESSELRIRLVLGSLFIAQMPVEGVSKREVVRQAAALARRLGDASRLYRALMSIVLHGTIAAEEDIALPALAEADALEEPSWPARLKWFGAVHRTFHHVLRGDSAAAMVSVRAELALAEQAGSSVQAFAARAGAADISLMCGDAGEAIRLGTDVVAELRVLGRDAHLATALSNLCAAFVAAGEPDKAAEVAAEAIELVWRHERAGYMLDHLSLLAAKEGCFENSLLMIGFSDTWYAGAQYAREGNEAAAVRSAMALNAQAMGAIESARIRKLGAQQSLAAAKQLALSCVGVQRKAARG